jgi:UDP-N-acetylmuramyl pentapeptide phosphotransferase/UDP-N-acetylglucosamine-1-phosphate transferase
VTPRRLAVAAFAATVAWQARRLLVAAPPAGQQRWRRTNFRGRSVDILGGPAAVTAVLAGLVRGESHPLAPAVATVGAGLLGLYDDLTGTTHARGLHGHLAALRSGVVTSGQVKLVGLAATGAVTSLSGRRPMPAIPLDTVLVAGTANLVNLLDLRPGRALKVSLAVAAVLVAGDDSSGVGPSCLGAAVALLPGDLREEHMLGDCGANALGAALGWGLATRSPVPRRLAAAVVVALNLVSEKVSFSRVIDEHPLLAAVDRWGRMAT